MFQLVGMKDKAMVWQIFALLQIFHLTVFFPEFTCHGILWTLDLSTKSAKNILIKSMGSKSLKRLNFELRVCLMCELWIALIV